MQPDELRNACGDGTGQLTLVVPRQPTTSSGGIRLTPYSGPIGYVLFVNADGCTVARFDCKAVLRWLDRQENTEMKRNETAN